MGKWEAISNYSCSSAVKAMPHEVGDPNLLSPLAPVKSLCAVALWDGNVGIIYIVQISSSAQVGKRFGAC